MRMSGSICMFGDALGGEVVHTTESHVFCASLKFCLLLVKVLESNCLPAFCFVRLRWFTSGCQNSWRKAAFQCTVTYGIFIK
jgi:hypothetical protein